MAVSMLYRRIKEEIGDVRQLSHVQGRKKEGLCSVLFETAQDLRDLEGSVLWVCRSPYRKRHKRKNWYVDVRILEDAPDMDSELLVSFHTFRSGGKGGQHVNKVETGVRAVHIPTGISVVSTDSRSQYMNKQIAKKRLEAVLAGIRAEEKQIEKTRAWMAHSRLERGNPVRIYEGMEFIRKR